MLPGGQSLCTTLSRWGMRCFSRSGWKLKGAKRSVGSSKYSSTALLQVTAVREVFKQMRMQDRSCYAMSACSTMH